MQLSSKKLANEFNLHHRSVLRSIRRLRKNETFKDLFTETTYEHRGVMLPAFLVSKVGFSLLIAQFKINDHKKIAYYLERYVAESKENEARRVNYLVKTADRLFDEKMHLEHKLIAQQKRTLWQRLF